MDTNIAQFFSLIESPSSSIQFGKLDRVLSLDYESILSAPEWNTDNLYFLGGVAKGKTERASDADIVEKSYVAFDFDLRTEWPYIDDQGISDWATYMVESLQKDDLLSNYGAVVQSGNGVHLYYFFPPFQVTEEARGCWSENYSLLVSRLKETKGVSPDPSCKNIGRIFRMPGSKNFKSTPPKNVSLLLFPGCKNEEMGQFMSHKQHVKKETGEGISLPELNLEGGLLDGLFIGEVYEGLRYFDAVKKIHVKAALQVLSGKPEVNGQTYSFKKNPRGGWTIFVDGRACEGWIDPRGFLASGSGHAMYITEWLKHPDYGLENDAQIKKVILKYFGFLLPVSAGGVKKDTKVVRAMEPVDVETIMLNNFARKPKKYTWGVAGLDEQFPMLSDKMLTFMVGDTASGKTTWAFQLAVQNALNGENTMFLSLEMPPEEIISRYVFARIGVTKNMEMTGAYLEGTDYRKRFRAGLEEIRKSGLKILRDSGGMSIKDIEEASLLADLIVVDGLTYIRDKMAYKDDYSRMDDVVMGLKKIADKGKSVIVLHHFRKGASGNSYKKTKDDMKGNNIVDIAANLIVRIGEEPRALTKEEEEERKHAGADYRYPMRKILEAWKDRKHNVLSKVYFRWEVGEIVI